MEWEQRGALEWYLPDYGPEGAIAAARNQSQSSQPEPSRPEPPPTSQATPSAPQTVVRQHWTAEKARQSLNNASQNAHGRRPGSLRPPQGTFHGTRSPIGRTSQPSNASQTASRLFNDSPAKAKWRAGMEPDGHVKVPPDFLQLLKRSHLKSSTGGRKRIPFNPEQPDIIAEICQKTGAYVKAGISPSRLVFLWGDRSQVSAAKNTLLSRLDDFIDAEPTKKASNWVKVTPLLDKKDAHSQYKADEDAVLMELRQEPADSSLLPSRLVFLWPPDGPSAQQSLGKELEKLDDIRIDFGVHAYLKGNDKDFIHVCGPEDTDMKPIAGQLRELWKEAFTKSDIGIKVYLVEPPSPAGMKGRIVLMKERGFARPSLRQNQPENIRSQEPREAQALAQSNKDTLLDKMQKGLSTMQMFSSVLRMRVHFGTFVLNHFRESSGPSGYQFQDFCEMILDKRAKGQVVPGLKLSQGDLFNRCMRAHDLLEPMDPADSLESLRGIDPAFSASFEFVKNAENPLRLEVLFEKSPGCQEIEQGGFAWFKAQAGKKDICRLPLQLGMIDFARSDWQADVEFFEQPEAGLVKEAMSEFVKSIRFTSSSRNRCISSKPFRKVIFRDDVPVVRVVEKAAVQLKVKGTGYILELARFDQYPGPSSVIGSQAVSFSTSWGATLFDPTWDNILGGTPKFQSDKGPLKATKAPQEKMKHGGGMRAFFPSRKGQDHGAEDDKEGFWEFLNVVRKITELLGPSQEVKTEPDMKSLLDVELGTLF